MDLLTAIVKYYTACLIAFNHGLIGILKRFFTAENNSQCCKGDISRAKCSLQKRGFGFKDRNQRI